WHPKDGEPALGFLSPFIRKCQGCIRLVCLWVCQRVIRTSAYLYIRSSCSV
ncbi:MAG: hypothetical protein AVDCRST_MAG56-1897, partial [uncultured Cytophagales bacterium]